MVIVFMIRDPQAFVSQLGAIKFDQLLSGAVDEGIRKLVRTQDHQKVWYLRGSRADEILQHLKQKFEGTGVVFNDCTITSVDLPAELLKTLEKSTEMKKAMDKITREHEYDMGEVKRKSDIGVEELKRKNEQVVVAEHGRKKRAGLDHEQKVVKAGEEHQVAVIEMQQQTEVLKAETTAQLERKKVELQMYKIDTVSKAESEKKEREAHADVDYQKQVSGAEAEQLRLLKEAEAIRLDAKAEQETSRLLEQKRSHDLTIREREILNQLATKGNFNLIGEPGDKMVDSMITGSFGETSAASAMERGKAPGYII
jgi:regulator of protease activity HflC (stomatin/prohibitin superfamily)